MEWAELEVQDGRRFVFRCKDELVTWAQTVQLWQTDEDFRGVFTAALASDRSRAFFWETPPVSTATRDHPFECVVVNAPALARVGPDRAAFREHFRTGAPVSTFPNLGGDATLVAPRAEVDAEHYPHLAAFVRGAPDAQVHELWRAVGLAIEARVRRSDAPCWVSTSGLGVYWTHVRVDDRPKYYTHAPYRLGAEDDG